MKIISKFHDYYDSIQGYGIDKTLVYVRNTEEHNLFKNYRKDAYYFRGSVWSPFSGFLSCIKVDEFNFHQFIIGFCGKIYTGVCIIPLPRYILQYNSECIYSIDDLFKYYKRNNIDIKKSAWYIKKPSIFDSSIKTEILEKWFNTDLNTNKYQRIFHDYKIPIYLIHCFENAYKLLFNPQLKEYNFQRVKDPFTAYQEISQYISGVLGVNAPKTVLISDESMRDKKGFDSWSFKKRPTK